jgi:hypothetical protein
MNVLFVPHTMHSHFFPLVALARRLTDESDMHCAFLLPRDLHACARHFGLRVLDVERRLEQGMKPEMMAFQRFHPDVVVDDFSPTTAFFVRMVKLPRVSVIRKGMFPGEVHPLGYKHSSDIMEYYRGVKAMNLRAQGIWEPDEPADLFVGDVNLIPSSAEIEPLATTHTKRLSYEYIGPLLLGDEEMLASCAHFDMDAMRARSKTFADAAPRRDLHGLLAQLTDFLEANRGRRIIYFNVGLALPESLFEKRERLIRVMLSANAAVISNVGAPSLSAAECARVFAAPFLPMDFLCARADLIVHQCGSATYACQVIHGRPAIILGTRTSDRDGVAERLAQLGAAIYLPEETCDPGSSPAFGEALEQLLEEHSPARRRQQEATRSLREGLLRAQARFNFANLLRRVVVGR